MQPAASISSAIQYQPQGGRGVAIADALQGDGGAMWELGEEGPDGAWRMEDPGLAENMPTIVLELKL
jgi:hypothetical protein